jgi:hypothetical protein
LYFLDYINRLRSAMPESEHHQRHVRLPVIPDLRFEASYLRSISPYVHVSEGSMVDYSTHRESAPEKGRAKVTEKGTSTQIGHAVQIEWGSVAWITVRDQVISPLLQGALWCVLDSYFLCLLRFLKGTCITFHHTPPVCRWGETRCETSIIRTFRRIGCGVVEAPDKRTGWWDFTFLVFYSLCSMTLLLKGFPSLGIDDDSNFHVPSISVNQTRFHTCIHCAFLPTT